MTKAELDAHEKHAWTLAWITWIAASAILLTIHYNIPDHGWGELVGGILYLIEFWFVFALIWLRHFFLHRLTRDKTR